MIFSRSSNAIRDCCGGPSNPKPQRSATLNYKSAPQCPPYMLKSATLGRNIMSSACDVVPNIKANFDDKILWKFECDISTPNNPDVIANRILPDAVVNRTTTL
ncbi:hypothetical protein QE152_g8149 [Popillia japonica]|uniref:Uncharacterized protein n=1 Tax=Popillia japonica TaxID=7064 RepID=A0AAW1MD73_POPJA